MERRGLMTNKYGIIFFLMLAVSQFAKAQEVVKDTTNSIDRNLIFDVSKKIELDTATRNYSRIKERPSVKETTKQQYQSEDFEFDMNKVNPKIPLFGIKPPKQEELFGNYIKGGYGNFGTSYLEGFATSKRNDTYRYGAHLKHYSSRKGPVDDRNSGGGANSVSLFGNYYKDHYDIFGDLSYSRNAIRYYGYDTTGGLQIPEHDSIRKIYHSFNINTGISAFNKDAAIGYKLVPYFRRLSDTHSTHENEGGLKGRAYYKLDSTSVINLDLTTSFSAKSDSDSVLARHFVMVKPHYRFKRGRVYIDAGLNVTYENDTLSSAKNLHIYPSVLLDFVLSYPPGFRVYVGLDGEMERNTWRSVVRENPFVNSALNVNNTNKTLSFFGGAKATVLKNVTADAALSFSNYKRMYFFVNDSTDRSKFNLVYDEGNTTHLNFRAELMYTKNKNLKAGLKFEFNQYGLSSLEAAYHKPNIVNTLFFNYNYLEKLFVSANLFLLTGVETLVPESQGIEKINGIYDLSLRVEYRYNKQLSAFAEGNNLFTKEYTRYLYYPSKGVNFLLGLTYAF